jgi:hypothetical protein
MQSIYEDHEKGVESGVHDLDWHPRISMKSNSGTEAWWKISVFYRCRANMVSRKEITKVLSRYHEMVFIHYISKPMMAPF